MILNITYHNPAMGLYVVEELDGLFRMAFAIPDDETDYPDVLDGMGLDETRVADGVVVSKSRIGEVRWAYVPTYTYSHGKVVLEDIAEYALGMVLNDEHHLNLSGIFNV